MRKREVSCPCGHKVVVWGKIGDSFLFEHCGILTLVVIAATDPLVVPLAYPKGVDIIA